MKVDGAELLVTVSAGGALSRFEDGASSLLGRADAALYTAKNTGRDRTIIAEDVLAPERWTVSADHNLSTAILLAVT